MRGELTKAAVVTVVQAVLARVSPGHTSSLPGMTIAGAFASVVQPQTRPSTEHPTTLAMHTVMAANMRRHRQIIRLCESLMKVFGDVTK